jgi:hypothetical protein
VDGLIHEQEAVMKYLCLVYHDVQALETLSRHERDAIVDEGLAYCEQLRQSGRYIAASPLQPACAAMTVRVRNGKVGISDGPVAAHDEQLSEFYLIEARDLNDAVRVAAKVPTARVASVEVRPLDEMVPRIPS